MEVIAGIDIGGTKCAVSFIHMNGDEVEFLSKEKDLRMNHIRMRWCSRLWMRLQKN